MNSLLVSTDAGSNDATLQLATAAYLARYKGQSRVHGESDLRNYLIWCSSMASNP
jgi:integrase/recombinase XerD